ncbi:MAG: hypothetical protein MUQ26_01790 [Armatimonadetes bacterium]|nr:hypothetical protein [Armatimonadota bacterium]
MLTSRWVRSLLFLIAFLLAAQAALAAEGAADLFAWVGEDGVMALRAAGTRDTLASIRPGLYGPQWTGFEQRTTDSPKQLDRGRWRYTGTLIPQGQEASVDYAVTAEQVTGGVELTYVFTARGGPSLNALYVRLDLPVRFAAGSRVRFTDEELILPASYQGRPSLYYAAGKATNLSLAGELLDGVREIDGAFELLVAARHVRRHVEGEPAGGVGSGLDRRFEDGLCHAIGLHAQ